VLLVDDEDAVRGPAADKLRALGLEVLGARDGPEALRVRPPPGPTYWSPTSGSRTA
jgi:DNA-binding response OmpR family regulator